jgi:GAF domain-containing protein
VIFAPGFCRRRIGSDCGHRFIQSTGPRFIYDGAGVPVQVSACGKAFRTGKNEQIDNLSEMRQDPESFGNEEGARFFEQRMAEGLKSGCELPLVDRRGVVGVLSALSRSERAFSKDDFALLEQVARRVAIAVETALDYERATEEKNRETERRLYLEGEIRWLITAARRNEPTEWHRRITAAVEKASGTPDGRIPDRPLFAANPENMVGQIAFKKMRCALLP